MFSGGSELNLRVWQVDTGELSHEIETKDKIMFLITAPRGSLVAMALESGAVEVLNLETGEGTTLQGRKGEVATLSWSFDGRYLAGAGTDRFIYIWDWETKELVQSINAGNYVLALGWGRQSHLLASGGYKGVIDLWSADSGENLLKIASHTSAVKALAWSPQGAYLASGGEDGNIRMWDLNARKELFQLHGHSRPIEDLAWSPEGARLAITEYNSVIILGELNFAERGEVPQGR